MGLPAGAFIIRGAIVNVAVLAWMMLLDSFLSLGMFAAFKEICHSSCVRAMTLFNHQLLVTFRSLGSHDIQNVLF